MTNKEVFENVFKPILDKSFEEDNFGFKDYFEIKLENRIANFVNVMVEKNFYRLLDGIKNLCLNYIKEKYDNEIVNVCFIAHGKGNPLDSLYIKRSAKKRSPIERIEFLYKQIINN